MARKQNYEEEQIFRRAGKTYRGKPRSSPPPAAKLGKYTISQDTRVGKPNDNNKSLKRTPPHSRKTSSASAASVEAALSQQRVPKTQAAAVYSAPKSAPRQAPKPSAPPQVAPKPAPKQFEPPQVASKPAPKPTYPWGPNTKITATHILFWHGPLSNWHIGTSEHRYSTFSGSRALDFLVPELDKAGIDHPHEGAISTQLLARHGFNCGEQFMMACKAWLFERNTDLEQLTAGFSPDDMDALSRAVILAPPERNHLQGNTWNTNTSLTAEQREFVRKVRAANPTLLAVLRTSQPREQKALGRKVANFNDRLWTAASIPVVISACIARAEIDEELRNIYKQGNMGGTQRRTFVEGSPLDKIWGVGLKYDDAICDDERRWRGENRLGTCHDIAAGFMADEMDTA